MSSEKKIGFLETLSRLFKKTKDLETEEYKEFRQCKEMYSTDIERFKKCIEQYSSVAQEHKNKNESLYKNAMEELQHWKYSLYEAEKAIKFLRPNNTEDIEYRNRQLNCFAQKLKDVLPSNLDLRFHGTPIYFAYEILKSGGISSSAERFDGYIKSTDLYGEISASDIESLSRTVNFFMDTTAYQHSLPCGCLFVLTADGQTQSQKNASLMNSIDFKTEPERLFAIVTTPENVKSVKEWLCDSTLSPELVYTFDDFIKEIENEKNRDNQRLGAETQVAKMSLNEKMNHASVKCNSYGSVKQTQVHKQVERSLCL